MRAKDLIKKLKQFSPNAPVILATSREETAQIDNIKLICNNGPAIQICGESLMNDLKKGKK